MVCSRIILDLAAILYENMALCSCIPHLIFQVKTKQVACFELSTLQLSEANFDEPAKLAIDGSELQMSVTKAIVELDHLGHSCKTGNVRYGGTSKTLN